MMTIGFLSLGLYVLIVLADLGQSEKQRENEPNTVYIEAAVFLKFPGWAFFVCKVWLSKIGAWW